MGRTLVLALALLCCVLETAEAAVKGPDRSLEPPPMAEHVEWYSPRRPKQQRVCVTDDEGRTEWLSRKMPPKRRGREPFHIRVMKLYPNGVAYYAWKAGLIEAGFAPDGKMVVQSVEAPRKRFILF
ncbi:hypothetical protein T492DRAFT_1057906 [Pavlovales sp. CCMP2436]|nr:hypothetical protein T492DRAFT_1057906 [Pavlovales sp. CCMP2436]